MGTNLKIWRESASLILLARNTFGSSAKFNYNILCMKRSSKSNFMPGTYVFPGGTLSKSDANPEWLDLFEKFGFAPNSFDNLLPKHNIPSILLNSSNFPKHLAFRLCAIRETFEECGILLCKSPKVAASDSNWASFIGDHELVNYWQREVQEDPKQFLNLCKQMEIYPDVWSLTTWSNWKTPPSIGMKFNTIFFLTTMNQTPPVYPDKKEVQGLMWTTPEQCILENQQKLILLPVPQQYEISKLKTIPDIDQISKFAHERAQQGCETYWPYRVKTNTEMYTILPGDDLYPNEIDPNNSEVFFMPNLPDSATQNRLLHKNEYLTVVITKNFTPKCGHIAPDAYVNSKL